MKIDPSSFRHYVLLKESHEHIDSRAKTQLASPCTNLTPRHASIPNRHLFLSNRLSRPLVGTIASVLAIGTIWIRSRRSWWRCCSLLVLETLKTKFAAGLVLTVVIIARDTSISSFDVSLVATIASVRSIWVRARSV